MKKNENDILPGLGDRNPGFKVPEGYFESFSAKMMEQLPERRIEPEKQATLWQRVRPWLYMAAMFGGIWCMMYVFTSLRDSNPNLNPAVAEAFQHDQFVDDFVLTNDFNEYDLYEDVCDDSLLIDDLQLLDEAPATDNP